jgi:uncharacterized membrane protein
MTPRAGWSSALLLQAVLSASCGSLASVCGKVAFGNENPFPQFHDYIVRAVFFLLILVFNSVMLSFYIRVLQAVSALQASLLAFVCNYLVSSAIGLLLFGEHISVQWILGAMLMTAGAIRISVGGGGSESSEGRNKVKSI